MVGAPPLKAALVRAANFTLHHFARLPTTDASNGFRMFSRRVIDGIAGRIRSGLLLQHRASGEGASAGLADRRSAGALVRAPARPEPLSRAQMAAGLSALVFLCFCHDVSAAPAEHRNIQGRQTGSRSDRSNEMAANTRAPHHDSIAVDEHHCARGGIFPRRADRNLSCRRASRLYRHCGAHSRWENPDRAAVPASTRSIRVGAAGGAGRAWREAGRLRSPRAPGGDRADRARHSHAG